MSYETSVFPHTKEGKRNGETESAKRGSYARKLVDQVVAVNHGVGVICRAILKETKGLRFRSPRDYAEINQRTEQIVRILRNSRDRFHAAGMFRYLVEGREHSYHVDVAPLMELMAAEGLMNGHHCGLLDLGAGPGSMVDVWRSTGRPGLGIDLSPAFVAEKSDRLRLALIDEGYEDILETIDGDFRPGLIMTSMTLDRVRKPKQLLANVTNLSRQFQTPFVLATILPVRPEDDDESASVKIVYTDDDNRLTPGKDATEDREIILEHLRRLAPEYDVGVHAIPYVIHSSGVRHEYQQYCFLGKRKSH